jgi:methyl coenzyme M reductase alpha subunit
LSRSDPAGRKYLEATVHNELCERLGTNVVLETVEEYIEAVERVQLVDD